MHWIWRASFIPPVWPATACCSSHVFPHETDILAHETMHQCQPKLTTTNAASWELRKNFENLIKPAVAAATSLYDRGVPRKPSNFICLVKFVSPSALDWRAGEGEDWNSRRGAREHTIALDIVRSREKERKKHERSAQPPHTPNRFLFHRLHSHRRWPNFLFFPIDRPSRCYRAAFIPEKKNAFAFSSSWRSRAHISGPEREDEKEKRIFFLLALALADKLKLCAPETQ